MFQKIMALTLMLCLITGMTGLPVTAFGSERDDAEIVAADKAALKIGFSVGDSVYGVTDDLTLPLTGVSGSAITWLSDTPEVMADDGEVTRPDADGSDAEVTLTAMIAYGEAEDTKEFMVMVLKEEGLQMLMGPMSTVVWEGEGSEASPYQVSSAEHLADIPTQGLDKHYIQMTDITLPEPAEGESNWTPIGAYATPFNGTYDGGGHTIYNLTTVSGGGLFNFIMNGTVKNLRLEDADVASASHAGILANIIAGNETIPGGARIINCSTSGTVTGASRVGGLIGSIQYDGSFISWSSSDAQVTVTEVSGSAGGLLGSMYYAVEVRDSYAIGEVNGPVTGGLIGLLNNGQVKRCYAAGTVSGSTAGGLIAIKEGGAVTDSYYDTDATGQASSAGGTGIATAEMKQAATYTGWNLSDIWNMNEGSSYPVLRDLTGCHIVTYLPNGGTGSLPEGAGKGGEAYTLQAADVFTPPEGRSFKEWNTAADGKGAAYAAGAEITMPEAPLTLYAIWARAFEWVGEGTAASP